MIAKIFMCPSYVKNPHDEGNSYVKKLCHFYCKSTNDHDHILFILVSITVICTKCWKKCEKL